ncbi:DMT family transporter [Acinetobacter indicus]|uniref:DMT family transporter n=1 Tax=Acinetobacter indicus TaxID=756892 RepID=UPI00209ACEFA|nr:DMT family transporter [Acinetobacter indicus]MCO8100717.1 DMT family transporter [Acinetobacter indicus]MCO8106238.1 DMT family transporter [Acinetobacter indicus]MCO8111912.1 DMT family transporter [Acinetobacter indicus]
MSDAPVNLKTTLNSKAPQLALIMITMLWGGTFVAVKLALNYASPMFFVGCRFAAAALAVALISLPHLRAVQAKELWAGALIGASLTVGYGTQTVGLQTISSSESAFLTALYVPLVPILLWLLFRKRLHIMIWLGASCAFIGLVLLTGNGLGQLQLSFGQLITLLGAIAIALEIILISHFAGRVNLQRVTVIQLLFASLFAFLAMPLVQLVMNWAQRAVSPAQAAIIYAGEPVWASLFGRLAGERLPFMALVGGFLVVLGVIISEWKPKFLRQKQQHTPSASDLPD